MTSLTTMEYNLSCCFLNVWNCKFSKCLNKTCTTWWAQFWPWYMKKFNIKCFIVPWRISTSDEIYSISSQASQAALAEVAAAVISLWMDWVIKQDYRLLQHSYISLGWIKVHLCFIAVRSILYKRWCNNSLFKIVMRLNASLWIMEFNRYKNHTFDYYVDYVSLKLTKNQLKIYEK